MPLNEYTAQVKKRYAAGNSTEHSYRADLQNLLTALLPGVTVTNEPKRQKCGAPDYILQRKGVPLGYIEAKDAGADLDPRVVWIVDDLADVFRATDLNALLDGFGKSTGRDDPFIHFYETFLSEYDPALRKSRGVYYTPEPVVSFIVRAVDDILRDEFGLPMGLADTSKIRVKSESEGDTKKTARDIHKVQILDPAAGTGTFLAEAVRQIYAKFRGQEGMWPAYVEEHLLPRLHGFEILMAPYTMCHLKIEMLLRETGAEPSKRLRVYLTNSLEEAHPDTGTLWASWLAREADEANRVKRDAPVMVVMGNPPYSVSSSNKGEWMEKLLEDYKRDLNEKNIQPLSDDYIKFIRYGEYFIEKNGEGILAYISNNSFLDGLIHRQMRNNLLKIFDKIYILDLHGNAKKKEKAPDGGKDENVFDIMQGVSINLFVKKKSEKKSNNASVFHYNLFGNRNEKYRFLYEECINCITWNNLNVLSPNYFFVKKDFGMQNSYIIGFSLNDLFPQSSTGVETGNDETYIKYKESEYNILSIEINRIKTIVYRPFDYRYCYYNPELLRRPAYNNFKNILNPLGNLLLAFPRQITSSEWTHIQVIKNLFDNRAHYSNKGRSLVAPLYLYPDAPSYPSPAGKENALFEDDAPPSEGIGEASTPPSATPNLNMEIVAKIAEKLGMEYAPAPMGKGEKTPSRPSPKGKEENGRYGWQTADPKLYASLKEYHGEMKNDPTPAESALWEILRGKKLDAKFRRQHIIGRYIADFACLSRGLVVEVDGGSHAERKEYDDARTRELNDLGFRVIRFTNEEVLTKTPAVIEKISLALSMNPPSGETGGSGDKGGVDFFTPLDLLDYIYAVLHSPSYREKYREFLKIDFPRVPYPEDKAAFWKLVSLGGELRTIHLLENPIVEKYITSYPSAGDNRVEKIEYGDGRVRINPSQYFDNVPQEAWEFYIGGYQPAQKWLKDRKGRTLTAEDIMHWQKIIVALSETARIMREIDGVTEF